MVGAGTAPHAIGRRRDAAALWGAPALSPISMPRTLICLGANIGQREETLASATVALAELGQVDAASRVYETPPAYVTEQPAFLNAAVLLHTRLSPNALLAALLDIERRHGRTRGLRFGPRTLDLDIAVYETVCVDDDALTLPHPRLSERAFVLVPIAELWPSWRHPLLGSTLAELRDRLPTAETNALVPRTDLVLSTTSRSANA